MWYWQEGESRLPVTVSIDDGSLEILGTINQKIKEMIFKRVHLYIDLQFWQLIPLYIHVHLHCGNPFTI